MSDRVWPEYPARENDKGIYCECDVPQFSFRERASGAFVCRCGRLIPCELCLYSGDGYRLAEYEHIDYFVCSRHAGDAVNLVAGRGIE